MKVTALLGVLLAAAPCAYLVGSMEPSEADASQRIADALTAMIEVLDQEQRERACHDFDDAERLQWNYLPEIYPGVRLSELTLEQKRAAHRLWSTALSEGGYHKTTTILRLEQTLREAAQAAGREGEVPYRDAGRYSLAIFGEPGGDGPFGFRLQGHHVSWNFTSVDGRVAALPTFLGSNPAEVRVGPLAGLRALPREEDLARELMASLDAEQRQLALVSTTAPREILWTREGTREALGEPRGLEYRAMTPEQRETLWQLISTYAGNLDEILAQSHLAKLEAAGRAGIRFAWLGSLERGSAHYYRIQGPTFVIEYDNVQNDANHVHTVWHDLTDDFGEDLLRQHYEQDHR